MNQEIQTLLPMMLYGLILLVFSMGIALAFIVISYRRIIEKLANYEEIEHKSLMKANAEALEIIKKAQVQASGIIEGSGNLVKYNNSLLEKDLKIVSEKELTAYKEALEAIKKEVSEVVINASKDISSMAKTHFSDLNKAYQDQVASSYEAIKTEIEKYKNIRKEEVDKKVIEIVNQTALTVINKSLDQHEHADLVIKSLEEAKKKHVF